MEVLTLLRRLAEQHDYAALRDGCLDTHPDDPSAQVLFALAAVHLGDTPTALRVIDSLDRAALPLDARVDLAAVYTALGHLDAAIATLERDHQENGDHALLLARLGWCRLQQGNRDQALALYERSVRLRPFIAVYQSLLRIYRDSGRLTEMAACLDAARTFWSDEQAHWPDHQRRIHHQQLLSMQLDLWLAQGRFEAVEHWIEQPCEQLDEGAQCTLIASLAQQLAARDRHAQAEDWLRLGLRRHPQQTLLYEQLAELAQLQGRSHQAIALVRRAIELAASQNQHTEPLLIRLAAITMPLDTVAARAAVERARDQLDKRISSCTDETIEGHRQVEIALADLDLHEENHRAAEERYRRVLAEHPDAITALEGLGQLCMQLGRIDEAVDLFERVASIDPTRGHKALINARRFPNDPDTVQRLEQLARTPGVEGSVRASLLFQLAALYENRMEYDKAFALADEANAASRRLLRYAPQTHRQHCARIRHAFPKALYENRPGCGHESTLPVFIVGMPRSGTTLAEQIIAGHSRIHGAGELGTIPRVIAGLERWERHTGSGRLYPDCVDDLDPNVIRGIANNVVNELREYDPAADHVIDKLPHNFENIGLIKMLFPNAKIISVRRDVRDVAVSNYFIDFAGKHRGMGFAYQLEWIGEQLADHDLLMHHWHRVFPNEILEVQYEDIVTHPETSARRMLDYIGVEWEPHVLDFHALQRSVKTASVWQVRQPLYSSSNARWQRYRKHLQPMIAAANRTISWDPIEMVTLPEPGLLNTGVDHYNKGELDAAEYRFKQLLRCVPQHAAANFMLGLIYVRKGYRDDGVSLMERAVDRCPWNRHWRSDLARASRSDEDLDVALAGS